MRNSIPAAGLLAAIWLMAGLVPASADDAPRRKPGLWQITTIGAGSGTNTASTCIGADDQILTPSGGGGGGGCAAPSVTSGGSDTTIVNVVCKSGDGKEIISGAFTGDFNTAYQAQVKITFDPPQPGLPPHWGVTIDGKYLGADCGADSKN